MTVKFWIRVVNRTLRQFVKMRNTEKGIATDSREINNFGIFKIIKMNAYEN